MSEQARDIAELKALSRKEKQLLVGKERRSLQLHEKIPERTLHQLRKLSEEEKQTMTNREKVKLQEYERENRPNDRSYKQLMKLSDDEKAKLVGRERSIMNLREPWKPGESGSIYAKEIIPKPAPREIAAEVKALAQYNAKVMLAGLERVSTLIVPTLEDILNDESATITERLRAVDSTVHLVKALLPKDAQTLVLNNMGLPGVVYITRSNTEKETKIYEFDEYGNPK